MQSINIIARIEAIHRLAIHANASFGRGGKKHRKPELISWMSQFRN